jgi:type II secretory pathway pseudopilin PulG
VLQPLENAQRDQRPPDARGGEAGYALTELLVAASLLVIVLGAILTLGETTQRIAPRESERAQVIHEAQVGLHRMTRELRHTYLAPTVTASTIQADVLVAGGTSTVSYECDRPHPTNPAYKQCLRYRVVGGNKTGGEVIVDRVLNGASDSPNPVFRSEDRDGDGRVDYVRALVEVAAQGDLTNGYGHRIVLDDGFYMRNRDA